MTSENDLQLVSKDEWWILVSAFFIPFHWLIICNAFKRRSDTRLEPGITREFVKKKYVLKDQGTAKKIERKSMDNIFMNSFPFYYISVPTSTDSGIPSREELDGPFKAK